MRTLGTCARCEKPASGVLRMEPLCEEHLAEEGYGVIRVKSYEETLVETQPNPEA